MKMKVQLKFSNNLQSNHTNEMFDRKIIENNIIDKLKRKYIFFFRYDIKND